MHLPRRPTPWPWPWPESSVLPRTPWRVVLVFAPTPPPSTARAAEATSTPRTAPGVREGRSGLLQQPPARVSTSLVLFRLPSGEMQTDSKCPWVLGWKEEACSREPGQGVESPELPSYPAHIWGSRSLGRTPDTFRTDTQMAREENPGSLLQLVSCVEYTPLPAASLAVWSRAGLFALRVLIHPSPNPDSDTHLSADRECGRKGHSLLMLFYDHCQDHADPHVSTREVRESWTDAVWTRLPLDLAGGRNEVEGRGPTVDLSSMSTI